MAQAVKARNEVGREHTWDVENVYADQGSWEQAINTATQKIDDLKQYQGKLGDDPATLLAALRGVDDVVALVGRIYTYASMAHNVDTADQAASATYNRAMSVYGYATANLAFVEPEMLQIGKATLDQWMQQNADLAQYQQFATELFRRQAHVRSAEVEQVLGLAVEPFDTASNTHGILADADLKFEPARASDGEEFEITQGSINALLTHPDREVRRTAWYNYSDGHLAFKNTMANCLATGVKQNVFNARVRNYESSLHAALDAGNIPVEVFHQLIAACRRNLPTWHRYWRLRREALGYDDLNVYDIKAPLSAEKLHIDYNDAVEMILEGLAPLGDDYTGTSRRGLTTDRWVDIYPNRGKRAGAYSSGVRGTHPFILMNYNNDVFGLSTLAHELGHSMHSYYTWQTQPQVYANYSIFVAEVASNFNQALVRHHLLNTRTDPAFQIALIEEAMSNFHRYFFIMPTLAQFELEIHQRAERGEPLTADSLMHLMTDLFKEGYGDEVVIDAPRIGITWAEFPTHMYSNFYVYQYATGIAGAHALAEGVLAGRAGARDNYVNFLKAGSSQYPLDALQRAGVDLTSPEPVEKAYQVLSDMVDRLEKLLAERRGGRA